MQTSTRNSIPATALWTAFVATALIGGATWGLTREAPVAATAAGSETTMPMIGVPTGEFENGIPVYRLPPIAVVVSRSAELARMAREAKLAMK